MRSEHASRRASISGRVPPIDMIFRSLTRRGQLIFLFLTTSTVNSTSNDVSMAAPMISPSPWAACPSPSMNSAPRSNTGKYIVTPWITSLKSMLAPWVPGTSELMHSLPYGAVPIVPKNGRIGTSALPILLLGRFRTATFRERSKRQMNSVSSTGGVTIMVLYSGASAPKYGMAPAQPQSRFRAILLIVTLRVSPGSAPSTKKGPVWGFTRDRSRLPSAIFLWVGRNESLEASRVFVMTLSPEAIRAAGGGGWGEGE